MVKKNALLILLSTLSLVSCYAQLKLHTFVDFEYSNGMPVGALRSYIPNKVFRGVHFSGRYFVKRNFTLGFNTGWNDFKTKRSREVYQTGKGTVSAVQLRYFHSCPFLISGYYYLRSSHYVMPYVGGGIGWYWLKYEKYYGVFPIIRNFLRFGLSPEIGVMVPFKRSGLGLIANVRYNKVFYSYRDIGNLNYFEASIGIYFGYVSFGEEFSEQRRKIKK